MQTALRRKTETGNEKDPSAALGMTKRERHISHSFSLRYGSQFTPLRKPTSAPSGHLLPKEGGRIPFSPHRHFERKREIFFVCDGSGKVRTADNGKHHTPSDKGSWCFIRRKPHPVLSLLVLISCYFFPRRSSPVIMDRD